jgi:hypothetical protein
MQSDEGRAEAARMQRGSRYLSTKRPPISWVSPRATCIICLKGRGPHFVRIGCNVRYHIRDLEAFIERVDTGEADHG